MSIEQSLEIRSAARGRAPLRWALLVACILAVGGCAGHGKGVRLEETPETGGMAVVDCEVRDSDFGDVAVKLLTIGKVKPSWRPDAGYIAPLGIRPPAGGEQQPRRAGSTFGGLSNSIKGKKVSGLLVFQGLPPGDYVLQRIVQGVSTQHEEKDPIGGIPQTESWREGNVYDFDDLVHMPRKFQVLPGRIAYVGKLVIKGSRNRSDRSYEPESRSSGIWTEELMADREHEIRALRSLAKHYRKTAWSNVIQDRLSELDRDGSRLRK